ncbi:MAG: metal-dependent transcriptional regulator [Nitrospirae bacterium]|nr:metal-dependent transcriptional regulator [Nitrospirota bacterium]
MSHECRHEESIDEMLETFWELRERNVLTRQALGEALSDASVEMLASKGMISFDGDTPVLGADAEARARDIVRRHRLAERLFHDVLDLSNYEADACSFEHVISKDVEEALCTFLGHPPTCPHNKPIPKGACCRAGTRKFTPLVSNLNHIDVGSRATVEFLNTPHLDKLASMGLSPGSVIRLIQKSPSVVIQIDETTLALDGEIVKGIYVKSVS